MRAKVMVSAALIMSLCVTQAHGQDVNNKGALIEVLNTYSVQELKALPGITTRRAKSIMTYRRLNGAIAAIDDLQGLPGFQSTNLTKLATQCRRLNTETLYAGNPRRN